MKKTLLAAALVAGFAGVAHAESSVTLYGLVDAGYGYSNIENKYRGDYGSAKYSVREFGVRNGVMNGNRWGLKGTEDLGNGTSAIFVLESGFDLGNGRSAQGGRLFGRQAYVGLTGDSWGTFTIGRQYNAADSFVAPIDPFGTGGAYASATTIFGGSLSQRYDNAMKYVSPNFSGFQFGLGVVHSDERVKVSGEPAEKHRLFGVTTGVGYTSGPLYVGASFDFVNNKGKYQDANGNKNKAWNIGGTYDFEVVKLHLMYGGQHAGSIGGIGDLAASAIGAADGIGRVDSAAYQGRGLRQHSWLAGLSAPVGDAGKVMFSYAGNTIKNNWTKNAAHDNGENIKVKSHNFALGYRHSLSKRTSVYGVASYGWANAKERVDGFNGKVKSTATQAVIGLQHRF